MKKIELKDCVDISSSKRIKMNEYVSSGIPFFRSKEIINLHLNQKIKTELFISEKRFNEINNKFGSPKEGDILLTSVGTLGIPYQVKKTDKFYFKDGNLTWFKNFSKEIENRYLYYWLLSPIAKKQMEQITIGSTQKALTISSLKKIKIEIPTLKEQKKIVNLLDSIQKKIDLDKLICKIINDIEELIFKSWFIKFEPVREKKENKTISLPKELSNLFPNSFETSQLGDIPKGWKAVKIGSVMEFIYGSALTKKNRTDGNIPVYGSNGVVGFHNEKNTNGPGIIVGRAGNAGTVTWSNKNFFIIDSAFSVKTKDNIKSNFYYHILKKLKLERLNTGSAIPGLNRNHAYAELFVKPETKVIEKFNELSSSCKNKIENNLEQINILSMIRDTFLQKLFSGYIKIKD